MKNLIRTMAMAAPMAALISTSGIPAVAQGKGGPKDAKDGRRGYYLTVDFHTGSEAPSACAPGYHSVRNSQTAPAEPTIAPP